MLLDVLWGKRGVHINGLTEKAIRVEYLIKFIMLAKNYSNVEYYECVWSDCSVLAEIVHRKFYFLDTSC